MLFALFLRFRQLGKFNIKWKQRKKRGEFLFLFYLFIFLTLSTFTTVNNMKCEYDMLQAAVRSAPAKADGKNISLENYICELLFCFCSSCSTPPPLVYSIFSLHIRRILHHVLSHKICMLLRYCVVCSWDIQDIFEAMCICEKQIEMENLRLISDEMSSFMTKNNFLPFSCLIVWKIFILQSFSTLYRFVVDCLEFLTFYVYVNYWTQYFDM